VALPLDVAELSSRLLPRCPFPPSGTAVRCGLSGGADSVALVTLATASGCVVTAVHVDHGLRAASGAEADAARRIAAALDVPFELARIDLQDGPNLEARAREARYAVLGPGVLTGHTADDQAETVLLNVLRGAGLDGLSAMTPGPTRPLLGLRRAETTALARAVAAALGVAIVDDASNRDPRFRRNRVRHELLPLLDDIAGRDTVPLLTRTADLARDDLASLAIAAAGIDPTDARAVAAAPTALARRALRSWLASGGYPPDAAAVERVLAVARGERTACEISGGRRVERRQQRLHVVTPDHYPPQQV
jgi:tRNA(Ile)-lysidine synthase